MNTNLLDIASTALYQGRTLLYPTDTIWGIGCDSANYDAVERIYAIKERDHSKSMLVLANEKMLSSLVPPEVRALLMSPRPTTVVMPQSMLLKPVATNLPAKDMTIGVRIPRHEFCQQLLNLLGRPIVSTSANLSGEPSPQCYEDISDEVRKRVDCSLPDDESFHHEPVGSSRIVKLAEDGSLTIIRE